MLKNTLMMSNKNVYSQSNNVEMICHFDGDYSDATGNHTLSSSNYVNLSTVNPKFGSHCLDFTSSNYAYLSYTGNMDRFSIQNGELTIDFWINDEFGTSNQVLGGISWSSSLGIGIQLYSSYTILYINGVRNNMSAAGRPAVGVWTHFALVLKDGLYTLYYNGVAKGTIIMTESLNLPVTSFIMGNNGISSFSGKLDEYRFTKKALWDSNFSVPTTPYNL